MGHWPHPTQLWMFLQGLQAMGRASSTICIHDIVIKKSVPFFKQILSFMNDTLNATTHTNRSLYGFHNTGDGRVQK
jgi:hypothetical protein